MTYEDHLRAVKRENGTEDQPYSLGDMIRAVHRVDAETEYRRRLARMLRRRARRAK